MKLLELFSGTKSISKALDNKYEEIISVDILNKNNPTFCCDILLWDFLNMPHVVITSSNFPHPTFLTLHQKSLIQLSSPNSPHPNSPHPTFHSNFLVAKRPFITLN